MNKPNYIIIGTQRGGTTSLYEYLCEHPLVKPAQKKETYFFTRQFRNGLKWYLSLFPKDAVTGEATPYYLFHPLVAGRVGELYPEMKLIVLLRNPVERAYSHYKLEKSRDKEDLSFGEALNQEQTRLEGLEELLIKNPNHRSPIHFCHSYLAKGRYIEQLKRWTGFFPLKQILILKSEDLYENPLKVYEEVLKFLELPGHELKTYAQYNKTKSEEIHPQLREALVEYFKPFNKELYQFIGRDYQWQ